MKHILPIVVSAAFALSTLAGCAAPAPTAQAPTPAEAVNQPAAPTYQVQAIESGKSRYASPEEAERELKAAVATWKIDARPPIERMNFKLTRKALKAAAKGEKAKVERVSDEEKEQLKQKFKEKKYTVQSWSSVWDWNTALYFDRGPDGNVNGLWIYQNGDWVYYGPEQIDQIFGDLRIDDWYNIYINNAIVYWNQIQAIMDTIERVNNWYGTSVDLFREYASALYDHSTNSFFAWWDHWWRAAYKWIIMGGILALLGWVITYGWVILLI